MSSNFGQHLQYTLFGESHSQALGITIQGLPSGFSFNFKKIQELVALRSGDKTFNTPRKETNAYEIISGYFNDKTTGTPLTVLFPNNNTRPQDYEKFTTQPRPGHSDFVAQVKYEQANDYRGGGHFSGRMTTPLVFLGAIALQLIQADYPDFSIYSHIKQIQNIHDDDYYHLRSKAIARAFNITNSTKIDASFFIDTDKNDELFVAYQKELTALKDQFAQLDKSFPLIRHEHETAMTELIAQTQRQHSTLGGNIETIVFDPPVALGEPFFHSVESVLSSLLFSIGSIKAVHFGYGDAFINTHGAEVKDEIIQMTNKKISTLYNYNGGINGGITNGEDIVISSTFKPISSIGQTQYTFDTKKNAIQPLKISGRHDITIVNRLIPIIEAVIAIGLYDLLLAQKTHTKYNR